MTIDEVIDLLTAAAAFDRRTVGEADAAAWHVAIGDLRFEDCQSAVIAHYTGSTDWLMPAHVRRGVLEIRAARLRQTEIPAPPPELMDDPDGYRRALRAAAAAIADGRDPHAAMRAVTAQRRLELGAGS